jgi:predicted transcriptional regulator
MDFKTAASLGVLLSKIYAENFFRLLVNYQDISASEAASRLDLHIRTAQDFLESLQALGIVTKNEVAEGKRPYYRYTLNTDKINMEIDLTTLLQKEDAKVNQTKMIRERKNAGARFSLARDNNSISHIAIWSGDGRERKERRIKLTTSQGRFLYHLPFPTAEYLSIAEIMHKADLDDSHLTEIIDIVDDLEKYSVIEAI